MSICTNCSGNFKGKDYCMEHFAWEKRNERKQEEAKKNINKA